MTVSVVVPTCDRPRALADALDSIRRQTRPADEVVVVDNGIEPVSDILRRQHPTMRFLRLPPRCGAAVARNYGAMSINGDWVAFLDDDDRWPVDYLAAMSKTVIEQNAALVAAPIHHAGGEWVYPVAVPPGQDVPRWRKTGYGGSNILVERLSFLSIGGFPCDLTTGEDRALFLELVMHGYRVGICEHTCCHVGQHGGDRLTDTRTLMRGKLDFLSRYGDRMDSRSAREDRFAFLVYLSRDWRFPFWIAGCLAYPEAALRRVGRKLRGVRR